MLYYAYLDNLVLKLILLDYIDINGMQFELQTTTIKTYNFFYIYLNSTEFFYFHLGKYDSHLFKILLENFYGKNILDRIGAIKNNDNENETEPSVQNVGTQKRADAWLDGDNYDKLNQEYPNEDMLGTHRDWKRAAEVILTGVQSRLCSKSLST